MFLPGTHFCTIFISYLLLPFYPNFLTFVGNTHTKSFFFIWNLYIFNKIGMYGLLLIKKTLKHHPESRIAWPSNEEIKSLAVLFSRKFPSLDGYNIWAFVVLLYIHLSIYFYVCTFVFMSLWHHNLINLKSKVFRTFLYLKIKLDYHFYL